MRVEKYFWLLCDRLEEDGGKESRLWKTTLKGEDKGDARENLAEMQSLSMEVNIIMKREGEIPFSNEDLVRCFACMFRQNLNVELDHLNFILVYF